MFSLIYLCVCVGGIICVYMYCKGVYVCLYDFSVCKFLASLYFLGTISLSNV